MSRVLLVGKGPPDRGGISAFIGSLLSGPLAQAHDLRFLNLTKDVTPQAGRFTASNVARTLADARAVWRGSAGADVVHIHTALVPAVTLMRAGLLADAARARGKPVILHVHSGWVERWLTTPARRTYARTLLAGANRIVTMSNPSADALAATVGRGKVTVLDNWVDLRAFSPAPETDRVPRILFAGLLTPRKGLGDLLRACAALASGGVDHELLIAGGTPDEGSRAEDDVRRIDSPTARYLGALPHEMMPALYHDADIFCLPSWFEAMPLSILEAMAAGLPVVATNVGDIPRLVEDGVTGLLVPPNDPAALAQALRELAVDPERRRQMGKAGRRRVEERFDGSATLRSIDGLYKQFEP